MAHKQKGLTAKPPQWWKHLRSWKRVFWHRQRRQDRRCAQQMKSAANRGSPPPEGTSQ